MEYPFSSVFQKLTAALVLGGIAAGCSIGVFLMCIERSFSLQSLPAHLIVAAFFSVVCSGVALLVGPPAYFLLSRFLRVSPAVVAAVGVATGALVGVAWGHDTTAMFTCAGLAGGLVAGHSLSCFGGQGVPL